jgi:hypothetical protein
MKSAVRCLAIVSCLVLLASCGGSSYKGNGGTNKPITTAYLRLVNTVPDSPVLLAGLDGTTLTRVTFGQSTVLQQLATGKYAINVQYLDPTGKTVALINKEQLVLTENEQATVFIVGTLNDRHTHTIDELVPDITAGNAEVQVMQTVASQASLDVYLTDAAADLATSTKLTTVGYDQNSEIATIPAGTNYRLRVTAAGSTTVLYDSGVFSIPELNRLVFVVVDYFGPGGNGFRVVQMNSQNVTLFPNEALPGAVRIANMIPDVPSVDMYVGGIAGTPAFAGVAFGTVSALQNFPAGTLDLAVTVAGDPSTVLYTGSVILTSGDTRTLVTTRAAGVVVARATIDLTRPVTGQGQLEIINASPTAGPVDLYLIAAGQALADTTPAPVDLPVLAFAGSVQVPATYDVAFTATTVKTALAGPSSLVIADGGIYSIYSIESPGGGAPYQIVFSTD